VDEFVTIIGDGAMGTVCSILLSAGGHGVRIWGALDQSIEALARTRQNPNLLPGISVPPQVQISGDDDHCFDGCTMVLNAVPTQFMRGVWERLAQRLKPDVPIVSATKGIEIQTLLRPTQVIGEVLSAKNPAAARAGLAVISGPNIAAELARQLPASAVAAGPAELAQRVQRVFSTQWLRVYSSQDIIGVELAGAMKNVIALAAGMLDGIEAGNNAKAALVTRGLVEITRLGVAMGADPRTFQGLAGLGDLITTCVSPEGRNRTVGQRLGKGEQLAEILSSRQSVAEGVPTTKAVRGLAVKHGVQMPITDAVHAVLFEAKPVRVALAELMRRAAKPERETFHTSGEADRMET
jgi:glycerol-3-phosphate dehydrogenase (NAD(P)+)